MKANSNQSVLRTLAKLGAGADVVSGGELKRALAAGIPPDKIVFSGVGKTATEIALALDEDILCFNVESEPELELLSRSRVGKGRTARISVRVNPDVDAGPTPRSPPASRRTSSAFRSATRATSMPARPSCRASRVTGVDMHIGSQITDLGADGRRVPRCWPISCACCAATATRSAMSISAAASAFPIARTTTRRPMPSAYAAMVKRVTHNLGCTLMFEPGRLIVGNAGILVARVIYVKHGEAKNFVIIDAAMNDLIRPTLYEAHHDILPVARARAATPRDHGRRGRPGLRDRRLSWRSIAKLPEPEAGRSDRDHDGRRLWRGAGRHLQYPPAGAGSAGEGRSVRRGAAAHRASSN